MLAGFCAADLQRWDFHCVIDSQGALEDCSSHDCSLAADREAVVHSNQQVTSGVSFREVRLFLQKLSRTSRSAKFSWKCYIYTQLSDWTEWPSAQH